MIHENTHPIILTIMMIGKSIKNNKTLIIAFPPKKNFANFLIPPPGARKYSPEIPFYFF